MVWKSHISAFFQNRIGGVKVQGMWQVAVGISMGIVFVVIPMSIDSIERLAKSKQKSGVPRNTIQEMVYEKRIALRKLTSEGDSRS